MHVEKDAENVAKDKRCDNHHKNHREIIILLFVGILPSFVYNKLDLVVKKADDHEGYYAKNQEPCPVVIPCNIRSGHSHFCHLHVHFFIPVDHFAFQKFWDVENDCEYCNWQHILGKSFSVQASVICNNAILNRVVHSNVPFQPYHHGPVDGTHHGDGIQWIEDIWEKDCVDVRIKTKLCQGSEHPGKQIDQIIPTSTTSS
jgi:hypothetical protein